MKHIVNFKSTKTLAGIHHYEIAVWVFKNGVDRADWDWETTVTRYNRRVTGISFKNGEMATMFKLKFGTYL